MGSIPRLGNQGSTIAEEAKAHHGILASVGLDDLSLSRPSLDPQRGRRNVSGWPRRPAPASWGPPTALDEPTIDLHPLDDTRLIRTLRRLANIGNTVILVENDEEIIRAAEHLLDIGPGPGVRGGKRWPRGRWRRSAGSPSR